MVVLYLKIELKSKKCSMHYALMIKLFLKKLIQAILVTHK